MTNAELNKWQAALRSGEYKQARGVLASQSGSLCCIGVCAASLGFETPAEMRRLQRGVTYNATELIAEGGLGLPWNVWSQVLVAANDDEKLSFEEIADLLEFMREEIVSS